MEDTDIRGFADSQIHYVRSSVNAASVAQGFSPARRMAGSRCVAASRPSGGPQLAAGFCLLPRTSSTTQERFRFALNAPHTAVATLSRRGTRLLPRTSSTTRENASCRPATAYAMRHARAWSRRPPAHDAFSGHGVRRIARDGSRPQPGSTTARHHIACALRVKCAWKRHCVSCPAEDASCRPATRLRAFALRRGRQRTMRHAAPGRAVPRRLIERPSFRRDVRVQADGSAPAVSGQSICRTFPRIWQSSGFADWMTSGGSG